MFATPILLTSILKKAVTVTPKTSILEARDLLPRYRIKRLVIVKNALYPVGIITEKDLTRAISAFNEKNIDEMKVGDFMSDRLITVKKSDSIYKCAKLMKKNKISSVVVLNQDNSLAGIITKSDLVSAFLIQSTSSDKVSGYMTRKVITVAPEESLFVVQSVLVNNNISRLVVKNNGKVVGVITYRDFLPAKTSHWMRELVQPEELEEVRNYPRTNEFNVNLLDHALTFRAEDIMTRNPITIGKDEYLFNAALLMTRNRISGLPVVSNSALLGIITKTDIVSAIASNKE